MSYASTSTKALDALKSDAWIVLAHEKKVLPPTRMHAPLKAQLRGCIDTVCQEQGFSGKAFEVCIVPTWGTLPVVYVILAGLGPKEDVHIHTLEQTFAALARRVSELSISTVSLSAAPAYAV